jgi:hypothetical protein
VIVALSFFSDLVLTRIAPIGLAPSIVVVEESAFPLKKARVRKPTVALRPQGDAELGYGRHCRSRRGTDPSQPTQIGNGPFYGCCSATAKAA